MLVAQEAADSAPEAGGGLDGAGECQSRFGDLCEFVPNMPVSEQLLKAAEDSGRGWDGLLEVRRSSGDDPEEWSCCGAQRWWQTVAGEDDRCCCCSGMLRLLRRCWGV